MSSSCSNFSSAAVELPLIEVACACSRGRGRDEVLVERVSPAVGELGLALELGSLSSRLSSTIKNRNKLAMALS